MPDLSKYKRNKDRLLTFTSAWKSSIFGGTVLLPLGALKKGKSIKRSRTNPLDNEIINANIQTQRGGGYYVLEKVQ